jgi:hypothetical protein
MISNREIVSSEIRRLVLAKGVYLHGCKHAMNKDDVSRLLAIHHFDFTVEILLKCLATKYNVLGSARKELRFKDLWDGIVNKGTKLPLKEQIFSLHDVRNLAQHAGVVPPYEEVIKFKGYVEDFLKIVVENEFGIKFDELSLAELIENVQLKQKIREAEQAFSRDDYDECISKCADALMDATFDIGNVFEKAGMLTRYFGADKELMDVINKNYPEKYKDKEFYELAKELSKAIHQLGMASTGMQFLDEYRSGFIRFMKILNQGDKASKDELKEWAHFSLNFVTNLILKWQDEGLLTNHFSRKKE